MNFAQFRAQNAAQAPAKKDDACVDPASSETNTSPEAEKEHQNKALLKMKGDSVWIPKEPKVPGLSEAKHKTHHKVKIHFGGGKSEIRMVDDDELGALRRSNHITKVFNIAEVKNGVEYPYIVEEDANVLGNKNTKHYVHKNGDTAYVMSHKYKDPALGEDHYVHFSKGRGTVYNNDEGKTKATKLLKRLGYKAKE